MNVEFKIIKLTEDVIATSTRCEDSVYYFNTETSQAKFRISKFNNLAAVESWANEKGVNTSFAQYKLNNPNVKHIHILEDGTIDECKTPEKHTSVGDTDWSGAD